MGSSGSVDENKLVHTSWVLQQEPSGHVRSVLVTGLEPDLQPGAVEVLYLKSFPQHVSLQTHYLWTIIVYY